MQYYYKILSHNYFPNIILIQLMFPLHWLKLNKEKLPKRCQLRHKERWFHGRRGQCLSTERSSNDFFPGHIESFHPRTFSTARHVQKAPFIELFGGSLEAQATLEKREDYHAKQYNILGKNFFPFLQYNTHLHHLRCLFSLCYDIDCIRTKTFPWKTVRKRKKKEYQRYFLINFITLHRNNFEENLK